MRVTADKSRAYGPFGSRVPRGACGSFKLETDQQARLGLIYTVQTSTDLASGAWTTVGVNQGTPATDGTVVANVAHTGLRRFLRLVVSTP